MRQPELDRSSLEHPPLFRRMLAAADPLQISQTTLLVAVIASFVVAVLGEGWYLYRYDKPFDLLGLAVRAVFILANGLLIGRFLARWLGDRAATAGAFALATTLATVLGLAGNLQTLGMTGVMYCFARQTVAGRTPLDESLSSLRICWWGMVFLNVGFGYKVGMVLLVTWVVFCLVSQNLQFLKRLFRPVGLLAIGLSIVGSLLLEVSLVPAGDSYLRLLHLDYELTLGNYALFLLPWWPLLALVLFLSLKYGHYATLWFQLITIWLLVTGGAIALGVLEPAKCLGAITPPLVVAVAPALVKVARLVGGRR